MFLWSMLVRHLRRATYIQSSEINFRYLPQTQEVKNVAKMHKYFLSPNNGQWHCDRCDSTFLSSVDARRHLQEVHSDINIEVLDFPEKDDELSNAKHSELLNNRTANSIPSDVCVLYQCTSDSICSLNNIAHHCKGKSTVSKNSVSFKFDEKASDLQIERCINMTFCSLCDMFTHKTYMNDHLQSKRHTLVLQLFKQQTEHFECVINLEKTRKIINPLQLNSRKLDGTMWPKESTEITAKYICARCCQTIKNDDIINHLVTAHKNEITLLTKYIYDSQFMNGDTAMLCSYIMFKCSFCNEIIRGISLLQKHFSERQHNDNIKLLTKKNDIYKNVQSYFEPFELLNLISFENNEGSVKIMEQPIIYIKNHRTTFQKDVANSVQQKFTYICLTCKCVFYEVTAIIDHLSKRRHIKHFRKIIVTYDYIYNASISKGFNISETQVIESPICTKDISINTLEVYNNEIRANMAQNQIFNVIAAANINRKNDTLYQNEANNSGLFMPPSLSTKISRLIESDVPTVDSRTKPNIYNKSALNRYNKMYKKKYLDFEKIMFSCNQNNMKELESNLQFYVPCFNTKSMLCLVCDVKHSYDIQLWYEHVHHEQHITQLKQLQKNNKDFNLLKELMKIKPMYAKCYACNEQLRHAEAKIKCHIRTSSHKKKHKKLLEGAANILEEFKTLNYYSIEYFTCLVCKEMFKRKIEFMKHLDKKHPTVLSHKDNTGFDCCIICSTLWYGVEDIFTMSQLHCEVPLHQYLAKSKDFAIGSLPPAVQELLKSIDKTTADLLKQSIDAMEDPKSIQVMEALKHTFPDSIKVCKFGSRFTGLALSNSDIDIYLNFGDECVKDMLQRSQEIQNYLDRNSENWKIQSVLNKSRTPLISVKHRLTGLKCDFSFTNGLAVENSKFIKSFIGAYPLCRKLILFLKEWLSLGDLTGFNKISNYALACLVIFYLQNKYKAPSIAKLIKNHNQSKIISGWEIGVGDIIDIDIPELSIRQLLLEFFQFYKKFNYMRYVVCPLLGIPYRKESFTEISLTGTLPDSMIYYTAQLQQSVGKQEYFRVDSPMCIQDPFDLAQNLTKAVSIITLKRFRHYCKESASMLDDIITKQG